MPTFFARRYMRGRPPRREQIIGLGILGIVALVVVSFALTSGLLGPGVTRSFAARSVKGILGIDEKPLFVADPANLPEPPPPHEQRVAQVMLPRTLSDWQRETAHARSAIYDATPRGGAVGDGVDELIARANDYGATWIYLGQYRGEKKPGSLRVAIVDVGEPAQAFGLWRQRAPAGAAMIPVGRRGWRATQSAALGFWAGRYYTEIRADGDVPDDEATSAWATDAAELEGVARTLAGRQLVYGGPFWAESVLPADGRVADSLRYLTSMPFGLDIPADVWQADYENRVSVAVVRTGVDRTADLLGALRSALAGSSSAAGSATGGGERGYGQSVTPSLDALAYGDDAAVGTRDDRQILALAAGPYVFSIAGTEPGPIQTMATSMQDRWSRAGRVADAAGDGTERRESAGPGQARFVELDDPDIVAPSSIERYAENLYEKINGREGQYRAFHVVDLRFGQYQDTRRQQAFDVYLYDMAEPANAMGIYMTERGERITPLKLGRAGYLSDASVYFWKGKYYVNVLGPPDGGEAARQSAQRIAEGIASSIADEGKPFWADDVLPTKDRVPGSLRYQATSALGFKFLQRLFLADYRTDGKPYQMYILRADDAEHAASLFQQFADETAKYDTIVERMETPGGETMVIDSLGIFGVAFYKGRYLGGVAECDDQALARRAVEPFRESLSAPSAPAY